MAFNDTEFSEGGARPIFTFKFSRQGKSWYYTNADQDIELDSQVYTAFPIQMNSIVQSGDSNADDQKLTVPRVMPFALYLDTIQPSAKITLTMRRLHMAGDATDGSYDAPVLANAPVCWVGTFAALGRPTPSTRILTFNALSLSRSGLRLSWCSTCPHMLYGPGCKVDPQDYRVDVASITVVDGVTITADEATGFDDGWFDGGYLEWESEAGVIEQRGIEKHVGDTLSMFGTTQSLDTGAEFRIYPGCLRVPTVCDEKFDNMDNYGGIHHLAGRSPFDGNPVF